MDKRGELVRYGRLLAGKGLVIGAGGNISVRDGSHIIVKKKGVDMSVSAEEDYARVRLSQADIAERDDLSSEILLHAACYNRRPDIEAVVHVHSPFVTAAAAVTDLLEKVSYEFECIMQGPVPCIKYIQPGSPELAEEVAQKVKYGAHGVMLKRHGAVTVGCDLAQAYLRALALERASITFLHQGRA